jgi:hypothetical protein
MVAVDAVILEVLSCNNASVRYIFKGEQVGRMSAAICGIVKNARLSRRLRTALFHTASKGYISTMTTAEDIEKAVEQLAPCKLARFRAWFEVFDAQPAWGGLAQRNPPPGFVGAIGSALPQDTCQENVIASSLAFAAGGGARGGRDGHSREHSR